MGIQDIFPNTGSAHSDRNSVGFSLAGRLVFGHPPQIWGAGGHRRVHASRQDLCGNQGLDARRLGAHLPFPQPSAGWLRFRGHETPSAHHYDTAASDHHDTRTGDHYDTAAGDYNHDVHYKHNFDYNHNWATERERNLVAA